jgi:hypothetical protein
MKYLKILGLAAVAAAALMAIAGAGTASATVLCDSATNPCAAKWAAGTQLEFHIQAGTEGIWAATSGEPTVRCTEGILKAKPSTGGALETVTMSIGGESEFNWNKGCGSGIETKTLEGGKLEIHSISGSSNGTVTATGFSFTTTFLGASCVYTFAEPTDMGTLTGSATGDAVLDINTVFTKKEGSFVCPLTVTWKENFTQVAPSGTGLFVEPS